MRQNPMCFVFPRIVSCNYHRFGTGGREENLNSICILALNIINEKVFLGKLISGHKPYSNIKEFYILSKFQNPNVIIAIPKFCHFLKIATFLVLWWWFLFLILLGTCRILFRLIQVNSFHVRFSMLDIRMHR